MLNYSEQKHPVSKVALKEVDVYDVRSLSKRQSEKGASMVEFALVFPVFVFFIFAIIDGSAAFHSRNTMGAAVADTVRGGAISGRAIDSDEKIVKGIIARSDNALATNVQRIVIFKADMRDPNPTDDCKAGIASSECAVYEKDNFDSPVCLGGWCPPDRNTDDWIGVWVLSEFEGLTGMNPFDFSWTDRAVTIVEPERHIP